MLHDHKFIFHFDFRNLVPVTQLYVSVDASTKDSLKKIDRPLFKDFWERFIQSLKALAEKGQRTVYRLTLVKAWNVEEIQNYAELVTLGKPDFIEIKVLYIFLPLYIFRRNLFLSGYKIYIKMSLLGCYLLWYFKSF